MAQQSKLTTSTSPVMKEVYFPTPIYFVDLPDVEELNRAVRQHVYAWRDQDSAGIVRSNVARVGSWHSQLDMQHREDFRELTIRIVGVVQQIYDTEGYDPAFMAKCDNMWANISPKYGYNRNHTHPGVLWSGVYYVQTPAESGRIFFSDPRPQAQVIQPRFDPDNPRGANAWSEVYFQPIEGRLILFPAWLVHEVEPNMTDAEGPDADRISVSFNFFQQRRESTATANPE
jgi:uncharacterized protein (TIGR02466 family)